MEAVFLKLLNMSIAAGWLVLVIVVLRVFMKRAPKFIRCFLWALVAIRLLCPVSLESVLSLIPSAETIPQEIMYSQEPEIHSGIRMLNTVVNPVLSEGLAPTPGDSVNPMQVVTFIASWVWIIGMLVMFFYAGISYYRIHRQVAASIQLEKNLYACDYIESPFILGVFRPRIYIPSAVEEDKAAYVLAHERAHLKRHDHWWKPLGFALLSVYWFNPVLWVAYVLLCRDIELACDERVIKELGEAEKKAYSEALLYCSVPRRMIVACPLAFGEVGVKERVKTVLRYKKPAFWVIVAAGLVCMIVAVCFLTNPKEDGHETNPLGYSYFVKECCYSTPRDLIYSVIYPVESMPLYGFTADMVMMQKDKHLTADTSGVLVTVNKEWQQVGTLREIKLTEDNFDNYFKGFEGVSDLGWHNGMTAKVFREKNEAAWEVLTEGEYSYYLLLQEDSSVYLAVWYYDENQEQNPASDDSYVRWLLMLERADMVSGVVETPENLSEAIHQGQSAQNTAEQGDMNVEAQDGQQEQDGQQSPTGQHVQTGQQGQTGQQNVTGQQGQTEQQNVTGQQEDFGQQEQTNQQQLSALDLAIRQAILGNDADKNIKGVLFNCASHIILGTETVCGVPLANGGAAKEYVTVYAWTAKQSYVYQYPTGAIKNGNGGTTLVILRFEVTEDDEYILDEHLNIEGIVYARDRKMAEEKYDSAGRAYKTHFQQMFPAEIGEDAYANQQKYCYWLIWDCYDQAICDAGIDADTVVAGLIDRIMSNEYTSTEERELTYYGKYTLQYCFKEFLKGGLSEERSKVMENACKKIAEFYGEPALSEIKAATGQEWFDTVMKNAEKLEAQYGLAAVAEEYPVSWLVLELAEQ